MVLVYESPLWWFGVMHVGSPSMTTSTYDEALGSSARAPNGVFIRTRARDGYGYDYGHMSVMD